MIGEVVLKHASVLNAGNTNKKIVMENGIIMAI